MKLRVRARGPLSRAEREALALLREREARRKAGPRVRPGSPYPCAHATGAQVAGEDYSGRALACIAADRGKPRVLVGSAVPVGRVRRDLARRALAEVRRRHPEELAGPAMPRRAAEVQRRAEMGAAWWGVPKKVEAPPRPAAKPPSATYAKLNDGTWGIRVAGTIRPGTTLTVVKRDGAKKQETVGEVLWTDGKTSLCSIAPMPRGSRYDRPPPRAPSQPRGPRFPTEPPKPGAFKIEADRHGRNDSRYIPGQTIHAPRVSVAGGGPDGHYYTIISAKMSPPNEDNHQFTWVEEAWVRPATSAEASPLAGKIVAADLRKALASDLGNIHGERVNTPMPAGSVVLVPKNHASAAASGERVAIVGDYILHERVGDPDMFDSWYHYVVRIRPSPELMARVAAFVRGG